MKDAKSLLDSLTGSLRQLTEGQNAGDLARKARETWDEQSTMTKGAIAGGLLGVLLSGNARRMVGSVAKVGGATLIGGLAYRAYEDWKAGKSAGDGLDQPAALPEPAGTAFAPDDAEAADDLATRILQAMVAAAKADGHVTAEERARIDERLPALGLGDEAMALIAGELDAPRDLDRIAGLAQTPEEAAQIYAASLLSCDPNGAEEQAYLADLAARLKLDPELVRHLHARAAAMLPS